MKRATLVILALAATFALTSCGDDDDGAAITVTYSQCMQVEAAKLLDETGSNADYANEMAAKACEALK